jgi:hypothetical protein
MRRLIMKRIDLPLPKLAFIVGTRVMLGVGIGLLAAGNLSPARRKTLGGILLAAGALTTIPAALAVSGSVKKRRGFLFAA